MSEQITMMSMREKVVKGINPGDRFTVVRTFKEQDVIDFANITKDYNPVHFDARFSEEKKFKTTICHGLLVASLVTEIGGQLGWLATGMSFKFIKPVYIGDTVCCDLVINSIDEKGFAIAVADIRNHDGDTVIKSDLEGILPGIREKRVIKDMLEEGDPTNRV